MLKDVKGKSRINIVAIINFDNCRGNQRKTQLLLRVGRYVYLLRIAFIGVCFQFRKENCQNGKQ